MCNFFSCIIVREDTLGFGEKFKVFYDPNSSSHDTILKNNNIKDTLLKHRQFVRVEITKDGLPFTLDKGDWRFKIDEESSLPAWYENNMERCNKLAWDAWEEMVREVNKYIIDPSNEPELIEIKAKIERINAKLRKISGKIKYADREPMDTELTLLFDKIDTVFKIKCMSRNIDAVRRGIDPLEATFMFNDPFLISLRQPYIDILDKYMKLVEDAEKCVTF